MSNPVTNPLSYNGYISAVATLAVYQTTLISGVLTFNDAPVQALVPTMLDYAELRIQRDLDLLPSQTTRPYTMTTGNNVLTLSVDDFVTVQTVSPTGFAPLTPVSKEFLQNVFPSGSTAGLPQYFAMLGGDLATSGNTSNLLLLGPTPDQNYATSVVGTIRMPSLYLNATTMLANTANTFISAYLPDLLVTASLIYISLFQRNFPAAGTAVNDPGMAGSYEATYQSLLRGAGIEEARKKFSASGWSSMSPPTVATATR